MEAITTAIVTALCAGATFVGKETANEAIHEAYADLKHWIVLHFGTVRIDQLEQEPASNAQQALVGEDLDRVNASADPKLAQLARELIALVEKEKTDVLRAVGVDIGKLENARATFKEVSATGGGTAIKIDTAVGGELSFDKVIAGIDSGNTPKK